MATPTIARKQIARSLKRHPFKSGSVWEVVTATVNTAATALKQGQVNTTKVQFYPVEHEINEHEAENLGANVRSGDLKLVVDSYVLAFTMKSSILCDGDPVDVKRVVRIKQLGETTGYTLYVQKRDRA